MLNRRWLRPKPKPSLSWMTKENYLLELPRTPTMQLKRRFNTLSLNREFGKIDDDTDEGRSLPASSLVKIVETRRAPDYGPLWSMVVAVHQNGTPLRTRDGKTIKGWARTDCFDFPDRTEPMRRPSQSDVGLSAQKRPG